MTLSHHSSKVNSDCSSSLPTSVAHWMTHRPKCEKSIVYLLHRLRLRMESTDETLNRVETRRSDSFVYSPSPSPKYQETLLCINSKMRTKESKERSGNTIVLIISLLWTRVLFCCFGRFLMYIKNGVKVLVQQ